MTGRSHGEVRYWGVALAERKKVSARLQRELYGGVWVVVADELRLDGAGERHVAAQDDIDAKGEPMHARRRPLRGRRGDAAGTGVTQGEG